jgi:hypothetical protein
MMRKTMTVAAAAGALLLAGATPAFAQGKDDVVRSCSELLGGSDIDGNVIFTPSGNVNFNCAWPGPASGGGTFHIDCSAWGPYTGKISYQPSALAKYHCKPI